jgi:hypothetical protein
MRSGRNYRWAHLVRIIHVMSAGVAKAISFDVCDIAAVETRCCNVGKV